jgi:uncharacterized membrane protein
MQNQNYNQQNQPSTFHRIIGTLLRLPLGIILALLLFFFFGINRGSAGGGFLILFLMIFLILTAARFFYFRSRRKYWQGRFAGNEAFRILRERYAKGEITAAQFRQMAQDLKASGQPPGTWF